MKYLHTMIRVKDIIESIRFYVDFLGLKVTHTKELEDCRLYFLSDSEGYTQIELTENFEIPEGGYTVGNAFGHFAFSCDDLDKFTEKMKDFGYSYLYEPFYLETKSGRGSKIAFIKDPDGNEVELIES